MTCQKAWKAGYISIGKSRRKNLVCSFIKTFYMDTEFGIRNKKHQFSLWTTLLCNTRMFVSCISQTDLPTVTGSKHTLIFTFHLKFSALDLPFPTFPSTHLYFTGRNLRAYGGSWTLVIIKDVEFARILFVIKPFSRQICYHSQRSCKSYLFGF